MTFLVVLLPLVAGLVALALRGDAARRTLLVATAAAHALIVAASWWTPWKPCLEGWLWLDAPGTLFLSIVSGLFLVVTVYAQSYLRHAEGPERGFVACLLFFLASMTLVTLAQHFAILWVAIEATTLASAPLIFFHENPRSLEATWKYLLICSVGIALALLGTFLLAASSGDGSVRLVVSDLIREAPNLHRPWLKAAFVCLLVGYGTKMGLAPLHSWLPDAHSESPSLVSALLSGALLNCAFLGILRALSVLGAADLAEFGQGLLWGFGLISMAFAALFLVRQPDYKRMLAYSSVEHMGVLAIGVGLGGLATYGAMLHAVNHSVAKALLFLVAGNILAAYGTQSVSRVRGVLGKLPISGPLWVAGLFAIAGSPPFGLFHSELTILRGAVGAGHLFIGVAYLVLLSVIFVGMSRAVLRMAQGRAEGPKCEERGTRVAAPAVLAGLVLLLGVYVPPVLDSMLWAASRTIGAAP